MDTRFDFFVSRGGRGGAVGAVPVEARLGLEVESGAPSRDAPRRRGVRPCGRVGSGAPAVRVIPSRYIIIMMMIIITLL